MKKQVLKSFGEDMTGRRKCQFLYFSFLNFDDFLTAFDKLLPKIL